jgi:hypothetical protein
VEWLYSVSYGMKFAAKAEDRDYVVPPLQGLWWADDHRVFSTGDRDAWQWTMMIMAPPFIEPRHFEAGLQKARRKLGDPPATLRFEDYDGGLAAQTLHIGSYRDEAPTIRRLHEEFLPTQRACRGRSTPRDLPERPTQSYCGEAQDRPATAGSPTPAVNRKPQASLGFLMLQREG